jgi:predicted RNA binding protein YcfA (HicA-like mRNA interferase family)
MRLPRDICGIDLATKLEIYGYQITRQTGSHFRLTTFQKGEHHITVPNHKELRVGLLN